jgi:hypothetical protein
MAVTANSLVTPQQPQAAATALSTSANTNYTAPANTTLVVTAGANGARLTKLKCVPCATVTSTQIQLFRSADGGTTKRFTNSVLMSAYTMAQTTQAAQTDFGYSDGSPLILAPNEQVYLAVGVGSVQINAEAEWANY